MKCLKHLLWDINKKDNNRKKYDDGKINKAYISNKAQYLTSKRRCKISEIVTEDVFNAHGNGVKLMRNGHDTDRMFHSLHHGFTDHFTPSFYCVNNNFAHFPGLLPGEEIDRACVSSNVSIEPRCSNDRGKMNLNGG